MNYVILSITGSVPPNFLEPYDKLQGYELNKYTIVENSGDFQVINIAEILDPLEGHQTFKTLGEALLDLRVNEVFLKHNELMPSVELLINSTCSRLSVDVTYVGYVPEEQLNVCVFDEQGAYIHKYGTVLEFTPNEIYMVKRADISLPELEVTMAELNKISISPKFIVYGVNQNGTEFTLLVSTAYDVNVILKSHNIAECIIYYVDSVLSPTEITSYTEEHLTIKASAI